MAIEHSVFIAGPDFEAHLAALDARHPVHYGRRLLFFHCISPEQRDIQLSAFEAGLKVLVRKCPILGGRVVSLSSGETKDGNEDWRTIIPDKGIELIVRDFTDRLPSLAQLEATNFPLADLPYDLLVPIPADISNDRPFAACKMQFSSIEGGTILTFAMSHCIGDGSANNELMRILSEETRRYQRKGAEAAAIETADVPIGLDRSLLRNMTSNRPFDWKDHPAFVQEVKSPPDAKAAAGLAADTPETSIVLHISPLNLIKLKSDAITAEKPPISTHDALAALMWRTVLSIRSQRNAVTASAITANFYMPSDARKHTGLTGEYIGNVVYQLTASLNLARLISPDGLREAAAAIRGAINAVNSELVACYMAKIRDEWVEWKFMTDYDTTGLAMGTDWTSGVMYEDDWGDAFGPLLRFRYPGEAGGFCCVFPKLPDGSAEILLAVKPEEIEKVKGPEFFGNYCTR